MKLWHCLDAYGLALLDEEDLKVVREKEDRKQADFERLASSPAHRATSSSPQPPVAHQTPAPSRVVPGIPAPVPGVKHFVPPKRFIFNYSSTVIIICRCYWLYTLIPRPAIVCLAEARLLCNHPVIPIRRPATRCHREASRPTVHRNPVRKSALYISLDEHIHIVPPRHSPRHGTLGNRERTIPKVPAARDAALAADAAPQASRSYVAPPCEALARPPARRTQRHCAVIGARPPAIGRAGPGDCPLVSQAECWGAHEPRRVCDPAPQSSSSLGPRRPTRDCFVSLAG